MALTPQRLGAPPTPQPTVGAGFPFSAPNFPFFNPSLYPPQYGYPTYDPYNPYYNNYDQSTTSGQESSVAICVACQLAAALVHDKLTKMNKDYLNILKNKAQVTLIDTGTDNKMKLMLESLGVNHQVVVTEALNATAFPPTHTVFITGMTKDTTLLPEVAQKLSNFVAEGGQLVSFNWAINFLQSEFPGTVESTGKQTLQRLPSRVTFREDTEEKLFEYYEQNCFMILEEGAQLIKVVDTDRVEILCQAKELAKKMGKDVTVARFKHERGLVYHFISPLQRKKVG
eukprot:TRINITY_DN1416_c0_g1_i2.p1 TRINITY_DN1416_c0_g1~~TRINITY_DN1416_c0_g1_i2.p1  ORF type:complete len:285 (-),score=51.93 TRINITY_DN1416_c0_g1_i2:442-1296(-)